MAKWDVIIIGAGTAGLGVGALLANAGKKVLVLEKEGYIGGRACVMQPDGQALDNGPHIPGRVGYLEEVFSRVKKPFPEFGPSYHGIEVYHNGRWQSLMELISRREFRKVIEAVVKLSYDDLEKLDDVELKKWVCDQTDDEGVRLFFWYWGMAMCVGNMFGPISTGESLTFLKQHLEKWGGLGADVGNVIIGGLSKLMGPLADVIRERGGEIRTNAKVVNVLFEKDAVRGVEVEIGKKLVPSQILETELIEGRIVVSTLPLWNLFTVLPEDALPFWFTSWVRSIEHKVSNVWSVTYILKQPFWDVSTMRWAPKLPRSKVGMLSALSTILPGSTKHQGAYGGAFLMQPLWYEVADIFRFGEAQTRNRIIAHFKLFEQDIKDLYPDIETNLLEKTWGAAPYCIAQVPSVVGRSRPSYRAPAYENLYLVSDTVREARGLGMAAVAKAAIECADLILTKSE